MFQKTEFFEFSEGFRPYSGQPPSCFNQRSALASRFVAGGAKCRNPPTFTDLASDV